MKTLQEILARKAEIRSLLEGDQEVDLSALETELRSLDEMQKTIETRQRLMKEAAAINNGQAGRQIETFNGLEDRNAVITDNDDPLSTPEYRSAFLKNLQGKRLTDVEERALTSGAGSAGAAVPTTTLNMIIQKLQQTSVLFPMINVTYIPGNLSLVVANAKNAAAWKTEGTDGAPADDTVINVNLGGYELIKLVEISAAATQMTIDAFETYISDEIGRQISIAIENAILNGSGTGQPTGILTGITWTTGANRIDWGAGAVGYDNIMDGLALLPTMYHNQACFCMNRKTLFSGIRKIKDTTGHPLFNYNPQESFSPRILGYPVVMNDYVPDDVILICNPQYYYMNFSKAVELTSSREAGFKSGKITYRGLAVVDGKPALQEAFVKISKTGA
jgi:HK97 family phage major capsid protein